MGLEFGVFDHVDRYDLPLTQFYEDRFKLLEAYDRAGFYGYHVAEHHSTPLGMSPSPSVYLAGRRATHQAAALRPAGLHAGALPSAAAGRRNLHARPDEPRPLLIGVGKGISPIEVGYYGVDYAKADRMFTEAMESSCARR